MSKNTQSLKTVTRKCQKPKGKSDKLHLAIVTLYRQLPPAPSQHLQWILLYVHV